MDTIKICTENKPLMIAHQGGSGLELGNTNAAFVAAGNRSYFGIETDVHKKFYLWRKILPLSTSAREFCKILL